MQEPAHQHPFTAIIKLDSKWFQVIFKHYGSHTLVKDNKMQVSTFNGGIHYLSALAHLW